MAYFQRASGDIRRTGESFLTKLFGCNFFFFVRGQIEGDFVIMIWIFLMSLINGFSQLTHIFGAVYCWTTVQNSHQVFGNLFW